jgi:HAD superfamily hydrolase (TIGR01509 family)
VSLVSLEQSRVNTLKTRVRALIFDFDGLMLETESPEYMAWQEVYREHGQDLALDVWADCVGRPSGWFDPLGHLEKLVGQQVNRSELLARQRERVLEVVHLQPLLPGVADYLRDAAALGLGLAVASSSSRAWVMGHLERLGVDAYWACVRCREDVQHGKPEPDLYLAALAGLGVSADEAIAFEDSPNGVLAATRAGLRCVIVANPLTAELAFSPADLRLNSLADLPLANLLARFELPA